MLVDGRLADFLLDLKRRGPCDSASFRSQVDREESERLYRFLYDRLPPDFFEGVGDAPPGKGPNPFLLAFSILPEKWVRRFAISLKCLHSPWIVVCATLSFIASCISLSYALAHRPAIPTPASWIVYALCIAVSGLFHELGHASALKRAGKEPGPIGVGIYLFIPVFYADVSAAWPLSARRRIWIDIGGVYFQSILVSAAMLLYFVTESSIMLWFAATTIAVMIVSANPFLKMDGYWAIVDSTGIANLHARATEATLALLSGRRPDLSDLKATQKYFLWGYAFATAAYFGVLAAGSALVVVGASHVIIADAVRLYNAFAFGSPHGVDAVLGAVRRRSLAPSGYSVFLLGSFCLLLIKSARMMRYYRQRSRRLHAKSLVKGGSFA